MVLLPFLACAQTVPTSSSSISAGTWAVHVPYNISDTGTEFNFEIGRGGWGWDFFSYQVRNYHKAISKSGYGIARIGFTGRWSSSNSDLSSDQTAALDTELSYAEIAGVTKVFLLCGIGNNGNEQGNAGGTPTWSTTQRNNYVADCVRAANYIISKGYTIYAVAPYNEPDFEQTYTGNASNYNTVAGLMQQQSVFAGKVYGPSTLNANNASSWYNTVKNNINFANTHQLGNDSFANYKSFWQTAKSDDKTLIADEMHNVMEAMVCANYGGSAGTWWGFNGVTRGEYAVALANGKQLAYKERPSEWNTASVMKYNADGKVKAFLGQSERQGVATAFTFQSRDRLAYYDGVGPVYDYTQDMPGGASGSYQNGQTNAERLINIDYGESVPIEPINGRYKIVNKSSGKVLSLTNGDATIRESVYQWADGGLNNQTWDVLPCPTSHSDFSYVYIRNANNATMNLYLDAQAWNMNPGANASAWSDNDTADPNDWQYWHLTHIADGYYTITNLLTGMYLEVAGASSANGANVQEWEYNGNDCQLWKFVPADHAVDQTAPSVPTGLTATPQSGSIKLTWTANTDADIYRYMVYRYNTSAGIWECIGRKVQGTSFIDNTCRKNQQLRYRIRALDKSYNLSQPSTEVTTQVASANAMVAHWNGNNLNDDTKNKCAAVTNGATNTPDGTHAAIVFDGTDDYLELPYYVGDHQNLTFAAWVKGGSTTSWQRIFDFGNGEDSYLFLTPTNGSAMRFEIKANGTTQGLNATAALGTGSWKHVAVTIGSSAVKIYVNGSLNATATDITLRPTDVAPAICYLGRSMFDADPAFKGSMSDIRLYNYELSASEVAALAAITDNTSMGYDITAERLPNIADDVTDWDVKTGWSKQTSTESGATNMNVPYVRAGSTAANLSKTIKYLPEGTYKMTANAYAYYSSYMGSRNNQELFLNSTTLQINSARNRTGTERNLTGSVGNNNQLQFGYRTTSTSYATNLAIDNVKIVYQGTASEFAEGLENITYDIIGDAESLLNMPMNKDVKAALQTAVTNVTSTLNTYTNAVEGGTATQAIANAWISALDNFSGTVVTNAQNSAIAYAELGAAITAARAKATAHPQTTSGALTTFNSEIGDVEADYNAGNYTDAQIPEAVIETKRIANSYVMADAVENARETNAINVTALVVDNPTFTSDSYVGWTASPAPGMGYDSAEFFNCTFNMYQVLYGLPAGTYRFETRGFYRYGGQPENYSAYNNGTLQRNAKIYIIDATGGQGTVTADVEAISDDPSSVHEWGSWSSQTYNGNPVPDNMQAASEAIDVRGRYLPANGRNTVTLSYSDGGDLTVGVRKDVAVGNDWAFFGDFSLYYLGNYVTLDEMAAALPTLPSGVRSTTFNIDMTRTIVSNDNASSNNAWNTICFPFALSRTQIEDAFGEDAVVKELASVTTNGGSASLYFAEVTAIEANKPYIMKTDQAGTNYIFKGIGYTPSENPAVTVDGVQFVGNYMYPTVLTNTGGEDYYILNDEFKHSSGKTKIKGFRAYFHVPASSGIKSLGFHDDEATAIEEMSKDEVQGIVYDLSGRRVSRPSRGLYIVDGKKVLLK